MSLETGRRLHSPRLIELPTTDEVIRRVYKLAKDQFTMPNGVPEVTWGSEKEDIPDDDSPLDIPQRFWTLLCLST